MPISFSPPFDLPRPPCPNLPSPLPFPFPWPFPPWAVVPIGLATLLPFPFPWSVVPTEPPDLPCFTSLRRVHAEEGKCLRCWPGASKRPSQAGGEVPLPNGGLWALGWPLAGSFPRRGHITTFLLQVPALSPSFGERNTNPLPSPSCLCCADGGCGVGVGARGSGMYRETWGGPLAVVGRPLLSATPRIPSTTTTTTPRGVLA